MTKIIWLVAVVGGAGLLFYAQCPRCHRDVNYANAEEKIAAEKTSDKNAAIPATKIVRSADAEATAAVTPIDGVDIDGAQVGVWTMDFPAAKKLAAEKDLPLILNFTGSDWCGWCQLMDRQVFAKEEWRKFAAQNAILVYLNFPKNKKLVPEKYVKENDELRRQFAVTGFPTYVVLAPDATTEIGKLGADQTMTAARFIKDFEKICELPKLLAKFTEQDKADYAAAKKQINDLKKEAETVLTKLQEEAMKKIQEYQKQILNAENAVEAILDRVRTPEKTPEK